MIRCARGLVLGHRLVLRDGVRSQAVPHDGERGEGHAVRGDFGRGWERRLNASHSSVHQLQRAVHIDLPGEEKIHLRGASAGDGPKMIQAGDAIDRFFDGAGDRDQHLVDRKDAVIHADNDPRKVGIGKNSDRDGQGEKHAYGNHREDHEDDGFAVARRPVRRFLEVHRIAHLDFGLASSFFLRSPSGMMSSRR